MKRDVHLGATLVIVVSWLYAILPFWQPGINTGDMLCGIYRVFELDSCWRSGIFLPRVAPDFAFGYGIPVFEFYPPLTTYIAMLFHLVGPGPIEAVKATFSLGLLLSGLGMYLYAWTLFRAKPAALLATVAYMWAPYHLLDIYQREDVAESFALSLLPFILWSWDRLQERGERTYLFVTAISMGALVLTHITIAFFFTLFLLAYLVLLALVRSRPRVLLLPAIGLLLGAGISAFYWLPAVVEQGYALNLSHMWGLGPGLLSYLSPVGDIVQHSLLFDYWGFFPFRMGLVSALLAFSACGLAIFHTSEVRLRLFFFGAVTVVCLLLQLRGARPFWEYVPLVGFILFPWRLLSLVSLGTALLVGSIPGSLSALGQKLRLSLGGVPRLSSSAQWISVGLIALVISLTSTIGLLPSFSPPRVSLTIEEIDLAFLFEKGRIIAPDVFEDYHPIWVEGDLSHVAEGRPGRKVASNVTPVASAQIQILEHGAQYFTLRTSSAEPFSLPFHLFYFPGWQGYVDGERVQTYPSTALGLVTLDVPPGEHRIMLHFEDTPLRRLSTLLSLLSLCALVGVCPHKLRWRTVLLAGALFVLLAALAAWHIRPFRFTQFPVSSEANLEGKVRLLGYALDEPSYRPGETVGVTLYWLCLREMSEDYTVFVHLVEDNGTRILGQHDGWPVYNFTPTTRWEAGEIVVDRQEFIIDGGAPPGQYRILVGMYLLSTMQRLQVLDSKMPVEGNAILLTHVMVQEAGR